MTDDDKKRCEEIRERECYRLMFGGRGYPPDVPYLLDLVERLRKERDGWNHGFQRAMLAMPSIPEDHPADESFILSASEVRRIVDFWENRGDELETLQEQNARLREALEFYAEWEEKTENAWSKDVQPNRAERRLSRAEQSPRCAEG